MLTVTLLRHAKSTWGEPSLADIDRSLNDRGREAAPRMGALMRREGLRPDHILSSPSLRTRQTLQLVQGTHPALAELQVDFQERLYHALPTTLLRAIHEVPKSARHVLLIGHNPGLQHLAVRLTGKGPESQRRQLQEKLPTGGLVVLTFDVGRWPNVRPGEGCLRLFARPRDEVS